MIPAFTLTSAPLAPPTVNGKPGAYGIHEATLTLPGGVTVWGRGLSHRAARTHALRRAAAEYAEVMQLLDDEERLAGALEAGDQDLRD